MRDFGKENAKPASLLICQVCSVFLCWLSKGHLSLSMKNFHQMSAISHIFVLGWQAGVGQIARLAVKFA